MAKHGGIWFCGSSVVILCKQITNLPLINAYFICLSKGNRVTLILYFSLLCVVHLSFKAFLLSCKIKRSHHWCEVNLTEDKIWWIVIYGPFRIGLSPSMASNVWKRTVIGFCLKWCVVVAWETILRPRERWIGVILSRCFHWLSNQNYDHLIFSQFNTHFFNCISCIFSAKKIVCITWQNSFYCKGWFPYPNSQN